MPSIEAVNLTKKYGSFTAVSNLNLKIEGTKCIGFLGPNGSGKTTALKMFTDLIRPSSGQALINGINAHSDKKQALASVGTLIETPEIYPALTPREALRWIAEIRGIPTEERNKRIEEVVAEVQMSGWIDNRVGKFSKGMKQRICIAAALISNPEVVLLDEPTTGLDPRGMSEVRDIIKTLKGKNRLIFMSSHILNEVADVCDEVAMIDHGKLILYDTLPNVIAKFSGVNIVEVELLQPAEPQALEQIKANLPNVESVNRLADKCFRIRFSGGLDTQATILAGLVKMGMTVIGYKAASSELEEAYLNLIKDTK
jgi:ABC-2 type transport system ATP-binding protein